VSEFGDGSPPIEPLGAWRTLVRNFSTLAIGEGLARVLGLVAVLFLARRLEPPGFGLVTLGATIVVWFSLIVDSGTEVLTTRDISRRPSQLRNIAAPVLGLRLALSTGAALALGVAAFAVTSQPTDRHLLWLFALALPAKALNLRWMVLGVGGSKAVAIGNIVSQVFFVSGVLLLVQGKHDILYVPLLQATGELAYALVVLAYVSVRFGIIRPQIRWATWMATLRSSLPLLVNGVARAASLSSPVLLIALFLVRRDIGFYGAASRPVLFFVGAMGLFFISFLSSYSGASERESPVLFMRTVRVAALVTLPIAVAFSAGAGVFVDAVYGQAYEPATGALAILCWTIPALALATPYGAALIAADRQALVMRNNLVCAAISVVANLVAIPLAGIEGAAVVIVLSQVLVLVLNYKTAVHLNLAPPLAAVLARRGEAVASVQR
jgi:O-antigen/teichoic acid export membrane protein